MQLTHEEERMLGGGMGEAPRQALELQLEVGEFFEAERLFPVSNVHMTGDVEV